MPNCMERMETERNTRKNFSYKTSSLQELQIYSHNIINISNWANNPLNNYLAFKDILEQKKNL